MMQYKNEALQNKRVLFLLCIKMSEKTSKFDSIRLNKKNFHKSKPIDLSLVNVDQIVMVLSISLVTKKAKLLNRYVLFYLKLMDA